MGERYLQIWVPDNGRVPLNPITIWGGGTLRVVNCRWGTAFPCVPLHFNHWSRSIFLFFGCENVQNRDIDENFSATSSSFELSPGSGPTAIKAVFRNSLSAPGSVSVAIRRVSAACLLCRSVSVGIMRKCQKDNRLHARICGRGLRLHCF